ncbi:unnamed protein product [Adineta steineri]|uniref:Uncharacterized protein n=1 Tax=Adineta steineri TaxID=433720 RepID=A0A818VKQ7_9BILA|nr:unnamed protein product [Adineta steineri]
MANGKLHCIKCEKDKAILKCSGCSQDFCYNHFLDHYKDLNKEFDEIECNHDSLRELLNEQLNHQEKHILIEEINKWEEDSIKIIQQTANNCKQMIFQYRAKTIHRMENKLINLANQLKDIRQENDFNEIDLNRLKDKLKQLEIEIHKPINVSLHHDSIALINRISIIISYGKFKSSMSIQKNTTWKPDAYTIAGGYGKGDHLNQFHWPYGICIDDDDENIYIADSSNHRIVKWKYNKNSHEIIAGRNGRGNRINELNYPADIIFDKKNNSLIISDRDNRRIVRWSLQKDIEQQIMISDIYCSRLTMDYNGNLYVSDTENNEVKQYKQGDTHGTIVAGGNGKGDQLNQLDSPGFIFVDEDETIYVSDWNNHRVMKWIKNAKEGVVVAGGQGKGSSLEQLSYPQGILVDHLSNVYVADSWNHRIMRWLAGANEGSTIAGGNGKGKETNQFHLLGGILFDRQGNLCVIDVGNNRVQKFDLNIN